ncbi:MAG: YitT family protein [Spirochaetia bacterium]|jgi:uncharacterized membrane-anchored protein YitT (DUF2179 family)|nr:YitT family protein [Spirochaetia bacterium]
MQIKMNRYHLLEHFYIILGSFLTAIGIVYFVTPAKIANGGVSGIAVILFHTLGINTGYSIILLSLPLFFLGWKVFGRQYVGKSLYGTLLYSLFTILLTDLSGTAGILDYAKDTSVLLSAIFGGIVFGLGGGFVLRSGSNTGGTDILAQILAKHTPLSLGTSLTLVDTAVICASLFIFGFESAFYAAITVYITGIVINKVVMGTSSFRSKTIFIVSKKSEEIQRVIAAELDVGGTILEGKGMYTGDDRPVIMSVVSNNKFGRLINIIQRMDKQAFVIVQETYKAMGEGFSSIEKEAWASKHT